MSKKNAPINVNAEASLRASASLEIKAKVPETSVGRLVDALTDLFRPFSEARGLRADQIRLQREEVAIKIARLARAKMEVAEGNLAAPPLKTLVPLLEYSSQESPNDDYMIDLWSNLLLSACKDGSIPPRFPKMVAELNSRQARLFGEICTKGVSDLQKGLLLLEDVGLSFSEGFFRKRLTEIAKPLTLDELYDKVPPMFDRPGLALIDLIAAGATTSVPLDKSYGASGAQSDLQVIESLGIIRGVVIEVESTSEEVGEFALIYYYVTALGYEFFESISPAVGGSVSE